MAERDSNEGMIARSGQSRSERESRELDPSYVVIDDRSPEKLLDDTRALAKLVPYVSTRDVAGGDPKANWISFFPQDLAALGQTGAVPAQLAVFAAFAEMYQAPRALLNGVAARHLDFQYRTALGLAPRPAKPDHVHVVLTTKKGTSSVEITPEHRFGAGKDAAGVEQIYVPTGTTILHHARIASLRSIYLDRGAASRVRHAPIANSADGRGAALDPASPAWPAFGKLDLPFADLGFAIASPLLRFASGFRSIRVELELADVGALAEIPLLGSFTASLTGKQGWLDERQPTLTWAKGKRTPTLKIELPASSEPVVDYDPRVHGFAYTTTAPVLRLLFVGNDELGHLDFQGVIVERATIVVEVDGLVPERLENDHGRLDPNKPFMPFGPEPRPGARLSIGSHEVLDKPITALSLRFVWKDPPTKFETIYAKSDASYAPKGFSGNEWFTADVAFEAGTWHHTSSGSTLFELGDASKPHALTYTHPGTTNSVSNTARDRVITMELERSFLHAEYRRKQIEAMLAKAESPQLPAEPYTPTIQRLTLSYTASSGPVQLSPSRLSSRRLSSRQSSSSLESDYLNPHLEFFHHDCYGQRREQGFLRQQLDHVLDKRVPLLPAHAAGGQLLLGLADAQPGDSVSLLVQVAEGSADPARPHAAIEWSVLSDNHWLPLREGERAFDSTNGMIASGIVTLMIPSAASTTNTAMPGDLVWLRATVEDVDAVCHLLGVHTNGVALRFCDRSNAASHFDAPLRAGSIKKLITPVAGVKSCDQPYASFGGAPVERDREFATRVAERLRHKDRAISLWDYERIVLEAFPNVERVKCIPHAKPGSWRAPGHVTVVVVPNRRNHGRDHLYPRVDADTVARITQHLQQRAGMGLRVWVGHPIYQQVQLAFEVRFQPGCDFNHYRAKLEEALIRALSPWAFDGQAPLEFGGRIFRSQLLHLVERLSYVDYVTEFHMYTLDESGRSADLAEIAATSPDMVVASAPSHAITEAPRKQSSAMK